MTGNPGTGNEGRDAWQRLLEWYGNVSPLHGLDGDGALAALADTGLVRRLLDQVEFEAVRAARRRGKSWAEIAVRLGVTRQSAWERWREVDDVAGGDPDELASGHEPPSGYEKSGTLRGFVRHREEPLERSAVEAPSERRRRSSVRVPDVVGLSRDEARKVLGDKNLVPIAADPDGPPLGLAGFANSVVKDQSPEAGAKVPPGSPVRLWLDDGGGPGGPGVREPRRPAPDPKTAQQMRDEATDEAVG